MVAVGIRPESIAYRFRQALRIIRTAMPAERDEILGRILAPSQEAVFRALPEADQAHSIRVALTLIAEGQPSRDLLVAALLHDMAKVQPLGRVHFRDHVARVVLAKFAPGLLGTLSALPAPRWRLGIALAVHHPRLGAEQARELGCSPRTCWLIDHHGDRNPPEDAELRSLMAADHHAG